MCPQPTKVADPVFTGMNDPTPSLLTHVCLSHTASSKCPHHIDCVLMNRHPCRLGSVHCGSCLDGFMENEKRHCVELDRMRYQHRGMEMRITPLSN